MTVGRREEGGPGANPALALSILNRDPAGVPVVLLIQVTSVGGYWTRDSGSPRRDGNKASEALARLALVGVGCFRELLLPAHQRAAWCLGGGRGQRREQADWDQRQKNLRAIHNVKTKPLPAGVTIQPEGYIFIIPSCIAIIRCIRPMCACIRVLRAVPDRDAQWRQLNPRPRDYEWESSRGRTISSL